MKENIIYNTENVTFEDVKRCAVIAHADDFITKMPESMIYFNLVYDKEVGQKGSQVSGGQKQRIALARCLIRNPEIIMMDESTSALDADT